MVARMLLKTDWWKSKTCSLLKSHVYGWVYFNCSRFTNKSDYCDFFNCTNCSKGRVLNKYDSVAVACTKFYNASTNPNRKLLGFWYLLKVTRSTKCSSKQPDRSLNQIKTCTKLKLTKKQFSRPNGMSFCLRNVWSNDLVGLQEIATEYAEVRSLFVAVDILSPFLFINGVISVFSKTCSDALKRRNETDRRRNALKIFSSKNCAESIWADQGDEIVADFSQMCHRNGIDKSLTDTLGHFNPSVADTYMSITKTDTLINFSSFFSFKNNRINCLTKWAPMTVSQKVFLHPISLRITVLPQPPSSSRQPSLKSKENWKFYRG